MRLRWGTLVLITWFFLVFPVWAAGFDVKRVESELRDGVYHIDATFDLAISGEMQSALRNGVAMVIVVEVELSRPRRFWLNDDIASLKQRYELSFHPLSGQYLVIDQNTHVQRNFHSLDAAVDYLNSGSILPTVDVDLLESDLAYLAYIRVFLDRSELPLALKVKAYSLKGWRAKSRWLKWQIQ